MRCTSCVNGSPCPRCNGTGEVPDYWTTKAGNRIPIADLDDDHLGNILQMLKRQAITRLAVLEAQLLRTPHRFIAEAAEDAIQAGLRELADWPWRKEASAILPVLEAEAAKRKLQWETTTEKEDLLQRTKMTLALIGKS